MARTGAPALPLHLAAALIGAIRASAAGKIQRCINAGITAEGDISLAIGPVMRIVEARRFRRRNQKPLPIRNLVRMSFVPTNERVDRVRIPHGLLFCSRNAFSAALNSVRNTDERTSCNCSAAGRSHGSTMVTPPLLNSRSTASNWGTKFSRSGRSATQRRGTPRRWSWDPAVAARRDDPKR